MSADNYLYVAEDDNVYHLFASPMLDWNEEDFIKFFREVPVYEGKDRLDALEWAFEEDNKGYYEYGVSASQPTKEKL